jgi:hypothetical protein
MARYSQLTFTDSVKDVQEQYGSRRAGAKLESLDYDDVHLGPKEAEFIHDRDSFYMASVSESGWPYVQFRGGPRGFLHVLDPNTLGYLDFGGNRQYISTGNLRKNDRVALILMDYPRRRRLKVMAHTKIVDAAEHPDLVEELRNPDYPAPVERIVLFKVEAFDWNCPQHITPRFTEEEVLARENVLRERIRELEARLGQDG